MKTKTLCFYCLSSVLLLCCSSNSNKKENSHFQTAINCDSVYFSNSMKEIAYNFQPSHLDLNKSIPVKMKEFIINSDSNCIVKNKDYDFFMSAILLKMAIFHAHEAKQSFDLNGMKGKSTNLLIEGLRKKISNNNKTNEFFSSYEIVTFVEANKELKYNSYLQGLLVKFNTIIDEIVKKK